ncbi:MAG: N-formylglutamate amidohydrolase [Alphaproteobacteria bacterium]|nr:N-formylglutamate amidohydrolase [Alphaproteobacteria bacterium]
MSLNIEITDSHENAVVKLHNAYTGEGARPKFLLICEHASLFIPPELNGLGLELSVISSHVGWDLGAMALARLLMKKLNAPLVAQQVSRLVYDCNRPPEDASATPEKSEIFEIIGNKNLSQAAKDERAAKYYMPFHNMVTSVVENELNHKNQPIIVTIHSFTGKYYGKNRDVEIGILHDEDTRLSDVMLDLAKNNAKFKFERNVPYGPKDGVTHSLKEYALPHGLHNVMIEVRNNLLADGKAQEVMAEILAGYLLTAGDLVGET